MLDTRDLPLLEAALEARKTYWMTLGEAARAVAEPSPESLLAWKAVVLVTRGHRA